MRAGQRFGRLRLLENLGVVSKRTRWLALCDCGEIVEVAAGDLPKLHSCGCRLKEVNKELGLRQRKPPPPVLSKQERKRQTQLRWAQSPQGQATRRAAQRRLYLRRTGKQEVTRTQKTRKDAGTRRKYDDFHTLTAVWNQPKKGTL